ncbi:toprim domain-containing protein [Salinibaculum rarum]|uniref:toprim domain-containing protein n=1 Tax=Salinibaculum rarum TaxID=3058903 RepID=UPI00265EA1EE|nr:toprim domain-containing protein [Salinibaculum sp. KK48]
MSKATLSNKTPPDAAGSELREEDVTEQDTLGDMTIELDAINDAFSMTHAHPPDEPCGNREDTANVQACLEAAIEYYHQNLPDGIREHVCEKWGLNNEIIDDLKIGYTDPSTYGDDDADAPEGALDETVIEYLHDEGFDATTIIRTGLVSPAAIKHVYECNPTRSDCGHSYLPDGLDALATLRENRHDPTGTPPLYQGVSPEAIDLDAVVETAKAEDVLSLRNWWDARIVFPYKDRDEEYSYLIGRATDATEDRIYSNGMEDATGEDHIEVSLVAERTRDGEVEYKFDRPAVAVDEGTTVTFQNEANVRATFTVEWASANDWEDEQFQDMPTRTCSGGGTYLFSADFADTNEEVRGALLATDSFNRETVYDPVKDWLEETDNYELDKAKYVKQTVDRPWVNTEAVYEPMFGIHSVQEDELLLITEGVTDALMAQQHGISCISPCTTEFKEKHYDRLTAIAERAPRVYIVMDNEENNAGDDGALKTAKMLRNHDIDARVGELPRPDDMAKVDVAEYLKKYGTHNGDPSFKRVLLDAKNPSEFDHFDPNEHDPGKLTADYIDDENSEGSKVGGDGATTEGGDGSMGSNPIAELTLLDVMPPGNKYPSDPSGDDRGKNPLLSDSRTSSDEFVLLSRTRAYDHDGSRKCSYNPMTFLAVDAGCRSANAPNGRFNDEEMWEVWRHAKETSYVNFPDDAPVPSRAINHLARKHELAPPNLIPDSFDDPKLPPTMYNRVLECIEEEYGLDPGRSYLNTGDAENDDNSGGSDAD